MNGLYKNPPSSKQCIHLGASDKEDHMSAEYRGAVPKRGDRVGMLEQSGLFEVVDINTLMQTANLKSTDGQGHVTRNVPWTSLKFQGAAFR
jgi:hypothetical protein